MLKICLVFWESEPHYAYKCYAYKTTCNWPVKATCWLLLENCFRVITATSVPFIKMWGGITQIIILQQR